MLVSRAEAAETLACSVRQIDRLIQRGALKALRTPGGVRLEKSDVTALIVPVGTRRPLFGAARSVDAAELPSRLMAPTRPKVAA